MNSRRTHKKNLIISYKNLSDELREILKETYPEGYRDHIQRFEKPNGDTIFVVPLETPDTMYMVKFDVVIDSAYEEDDGSKDYFDEEVEKAEGIEFAPLQEAIDKEEEGSKPRISSDLQHGSLEEASIEDRQLLAQHKLGITAEELQEAFPDDEEEEDYDSYDDANNDNDDGNDDDDYEPTDEELMDIDSEFFANAAISPDELGRMVDEDITRNVSQAAREAQKATAKEQPAAAAAAPKGKSAAKDAKESKASSTTKTAKEGKATATSKTAKENKTTAKAKAPVKKTTKQ